MQYFKNILAIYLFVLFVASCTENKNAELPASNPIANSTVKDIHEVETYIDVAKGEETFKASCLTCHSLRYIQMQPAFPQATWEKIVNKMIKSFGAPIPDSSAKVIVNYLMAVKGKHD
jgi:cytochrome c5